MALPVDDDDRPAGGGRGGESWLGPKGSHKRTALQIGVAMLGVLFAFLLWRSQRAGAAAAASTATPYSYPTVGTGAVGGGTAGTIDTAAFSDMFQALNNTVAAGFAQENAQIGALSHVGPSSGTAGKSAHQIHQANVDAHPGKYAPLDAHQIHLANQKAHPGQYK